MLLQGLNITVKVYRRLQGVDDDVGGASATEQLIEESVPARIGPVKNAYALALQGISTNETFSCLLQHQGVVYRQVNIRQDDLVVPNSGQYAGSKFAVIAVSDDGVLDDIGNGFPAPRCYTTPNNYGAYGAIMEGKAYLAGDAKKMVPIVEAAAKEAVLKGAVFLLARVRQVFKMYSPRAHATGALIRSLAASAVYLASDKSFRIRVGSGVPYAGFVHDGTGPKAGKPARGRPPTDAIYEWIKVKGIVPKYTVQQSRAASGRYTKGYTKKKRKAKDVEKEMRSLAYLIAKKIGEQGAEPFPYVTSVTKVYRQEVIDIVREAYSRALRRMAKR